jgi:DNA-directed RNA polymerase subunit RPC12/RpoP
MIAWNCPRCAAKLNVENEYAGKSANCPKCQTQISVPELQNIRSPRPTVFEPEYLSRDPIDEREMIARSKWFLEALRVTGIVAWAALVIVTPICGIWLFASLNKSRNAMDDAAAGAVNAAVLICFYVFARGIDELRQTLARRVE